MKCPNCGYQHGWVADALSSVDGKFGEFFRLSNDVNAVRDGYRHGSFHEERRSVFGCPKCSIMFMEKD